MLTTAMGINAAMIGVAATIYPVIGGMLAEFSWRYVFLLSLLAFRVSLLIATRLKLPLPSLQSMLAAIAPEGYRAGFMALNVTVQSLGRAFGPLFAGVSFGVWGIQGVFYVNALLAIITTVIFNFLLNYKSRTHAH